MAALKDKGVVMAVCAMMAVCALGAVAIMPDDSHAANPNRGTYTFQVYEGQSFTLEMPRSDGTVDHLTNAPSWVQKSGIYQLSGTAPSNVGERAEFTVTLGYNTGMSVVYSDITVIIEVIAVPQVDFSSPGITITPDNNARGATYSVSEDKAIRINMGEYGFKMPGWWWTEVHQVYLTGDTHGFMQRDGYYEGQLNEGSYTFTINVGNKAQFDFYVNVSAATRNVTFNANGGSVANGSMTVGWGDDFTLPEVTRENFSFAGWYDEDGHLVGFAGQTYRTYADRTLTARWAAEANVQDVTVIANNTVNITPTTDPNATITVEGADWLTVMGNLVTGIAPGQAGDYKVTLTVSGANADPMTVEFTVHVISQLQPTNSPSNGAIVLIVG